MGWVALATWEVVWEEEEEEEEVCTEDSTVAGFLNCIHL